MLLVTSILYRNGIIHSPTDPFAEALLVDDGVVAWMGADDTADGHARRADRVIDLAGALVAPGFVDSHVHVLESALARRSVDLSVTGAGSTRQAALDAVGDRARSTGDDTDAVLLAHGWDESHWDDDRRPTAAELDTVTGGAAVYAARVDVHCAVVSSRLADLGDLRALNGWHDDGFVTLDAHEAARALARDISRERRAALYAEELRHLAALGIVAVHENSAPGIDTRDGLATLLEITADPASGYPLVVGYRGELCRAPADAEALVAALPGLTGIGGDLCVDGSLGARTAALRAPYSDDTTTAGTLMLSADEIREHVLVVTGVGVQPGFHVIGDRALDVTLAGLRAAAASSPAARSAMRRIGVRLEHAEMIDDAVLPTLVELGVRLSMQPAFDAGWGGPEGMYAERVGERAAGMNRFAALASAGIPMAFGSDAPVTTSDPWEPVRAAVHHTDPAQRISARAAFRASTRGAWRAAGLDHTGAGELRIGAPAHLAVWRAEHVAVQGGAGTVSSWSTDARSGTPLLPDLSPGAPRPTCLQTVRAGIPIFDTFD